jgi:hypothetical protein
MAMASGMRSWKVFSLVMSLGLIGGLAPSVGAITFDEVLPDAGDLPFSSQSAGTLPLLTQIAGSIGSSTDADMYAITFSTAGVFSATTVGTPGTLGDTQLFLFSFSGNGLLANDDSSGFRSTLPGTPVGPGLHFLAISAFNLDPVSATGLIFPSDPFTGVFGPTGPGGANPITGWSGTGSTGTYTINVALEPVPEPATLLLFGTALAGLGMARRRQRRRG